MHFDPDNFKSITYIISSNDENLNINLYNYVFKHYIDDITGKYVLEKNVDRNCIPLWTWINGNTTEYFFCSIRLTFLFIENKKYIFVGSVDSYSDYILDFETGEEINLKDWTFKNSNEYDFIEFLNSGLYHPSGLNEYNAPECYKNITSKAIHEFNDKHILIEL